MYMCAQVRDGDTYLPTIVDEEVEGEERSVDEHSGEEQLDLRAYSVQTEVPTARRITPLLSCDVPAAA